MTPRRLAVIVAATAVLAACNGNDREDVAAPPAPAATDSVAGQQPPAEPAAGTDAPDGQVASGEALDVCELLTTDEVAEVLGHSVEMEPVTDIDCRYTVADTDPVDATDVTMTVLRPVGGTVEFFEDSVIAAADPGDSTEHIDGLGDAAVLITTAHASILHVKASETWLTLSGFGPEVDWSAEILAQLARPAVQRLL